MREAFNTTTVGWLTIILGWVLTALALLSLVLYIWSNRIKRSPCGLEDILLYLSFSLSLALMSLTTWAVVAEGQGRHQSAQSHLQVELVAKSLLVNEILWSVVNTFLRISAVLFIRKVFLFDAITIPLLVASVAYAIAAIATSLAICQPLNAGWDPTVMGRCGNEAVAYICLEIIAAILDLVIVIAPLPRLMRLQISTSRKCGIGVLISLGAVVFIITGLRIGALNRVNSHDFSYDRGYIGLLSVLGPLIAIICCCTTACFGIIYRRLQLWIETRDFSSSKVVWSLVTRRVGWLLSTATRKTREGDFEGVISKFEPLASVSTLRSSETKSTEASTQAMTRLQSAAGTQSGVVSDNMVGVPNSPANFSGSKAALG